MEVTNKELLSYAKVLLDKLTKPFLEKGKYVRIDIYTKQSGFVVVNLYPCKDKSRQGIALYEGNENIDEPIERTETTSESLCVARYNHSEYWTPEYALKDLQSMNV